MELCISNLSSATTEDDIRALFEDFGVVSAIRVVRNQSDNLAFVDMPLRDEGFSALKALNGTTLKGSIVSVSESTEREKEKLSR